ncbi:MAG: toll/interleukin-1 receptor domain-containing protein [Nitrospiraceae bacterium]
MSAAPKKVFLSYARADRDRAKKLADRLREAGLEVWDPEQELLPGSDFASHLKGALDRAEAVVVLISPDAMESRSVSHEIEYALGAKHLRGRLIPVVVRPTKQAPWILNTLQTVRYQDADKTSRHIVDLLTHPQDAPQTKRRQAN